MTVRRFHAEVGTALATAALGVAAVIGGAELGFGWEESGPQPGSFPFYVGLILIVASLWNLGQAFLNHRAALGHERSSGEIEEPFLHRENLGRIATFLAAMTGFVIGTLTLGVYVAATAYIAWSAWRQGGYRLWVALTIGACFAIVQYVIFEAIFKIPLLKGPIEPLLGIY